MEMGRIAMKNLFIIFSFILLFAFAECRLSSSNTDKPVSSKETSLVDLNKYPIKLDSLPFETSPDIS
jgi:hypothetical protein